VTFEIGPTSFYQTNPSQTEVLYRLAIEGAQPGANMRVLDAYCGIGTIGLCAAAQVEGLRVTGVELGKGAVADARRNARINGLDDRCCFVCADATAFMKDAAKRGERYDAVIMDPPRAGSTPEFLSGILALAPRRVVYVSCNAVTQRRDLDQLLAGGYRVEHLTPVDMFPHTKHVETVCCLYRQK
jgi:23S rRNA (uracil-5-)-methyltransferase RumA